MVRVGPTGQTVIPCPVNGRAAWPRPGVPRDGKVGRQKGSFVDRTGMVYLRPTFWSFPKNRFRVVIPFDSRESIDALRTKRQLRPPFTSTNSDDRSTHAGAQHLRSGMPENWRIACPPRSSCEVADGWFTWRIAPMANRIKSKSPRRLTRAMIRVRRQFAGLRLRAVNGLQQG